MKDLGRSKYNGLLEHKNFRRWYDNVTRGSLVTVQEWFRRMGFVCAKFETTPQKISKMSQTQATEFILDVIGALEEGRSGNYISNIVKPLKSWLAWNDTQITRAIKIPRSQPTKVESERPPTPDELKKILNTAELRAKVACSLVAFGGCRIEVLGNYTGDGGLKLKDLPELKIENGQVTLTKIQTLMIARKTLSKAGHRYFTFLAQEGCEYLQQYLEWRLRKGEPLLSTEKQEGVSQEYLKNVLREQVLLAAGVKEEELEKLDLDKMSNEEFHDLLRRRLLGVMTNNGNRQKIIPASELKSHVSQGWEYVAQLPDSEVGVRLPT